MPKDSADKSAVRPFHVSFTESEITELRKRINATRWPEKETVADPTQGVQLDTRIPSSKYGIRRIEIPQVPFLH